MSDAAHSLAYRNPGRLAKVPNLAHRPPPTAHCPLPTAAKLLVTAHKYLRSYCMQAAAGVRRCLSEGPFYVRVLAGC